MPQYYESFVGTWRTQVTLPQFALVPRFLPQAVGPIPHSGGAHPSKWAKKKHSWNPERAGLRTDGIFWPNATDWLIDWLAYLGANCRHAIHNLIKENSRIHRCPQNRISDKPSHRGQLPVLFLNSVWVLWRPTPALWDGVYGSFSSVILRPWVLVRSRVEPATSSTAVRCSTNWANRSANLPYIIPPKWLRWFDEKNAFSPRLLCYATFHRCTGSQQSASRGASLPFIGSLTSIALHIPTAHNFTLDCRFSLRLDSP